MKRALWAGIGMAILGPAAMADFADNFEGVTASAAGTILTGQNAWYIPVTGSIDMFAFTYAGNAYALPALGVGGVNFAGGASDGVAFGRAAHDLTYDAGVWTQTSYFCAKWDNGAALPVDNIGSFSLNRGGDAFGSYQGLITLLSWMEPGVNANSEIRFQFVAFNDVGAQTTYFPGIIGVVQNHWYRATVTFDLVANRFLGFALTDMDTGVSIWRLRPFDDGAGGFIELYLAGGPNNGAGLPPPTGVRMFAGSSAATAGNKVGWDNVKATTGMLSVAETVTPGPGIVLAGDIRSSFEDDGLRLETRPGVVLNSSLPPVVVAMKFTSPVLAPSTLSAVVEGNGTTPLTVEVQFKRAGTSTWDTIGATAAFTSSDAEITRSVSASTTTYIDQTTGEVDVRVRAKASGAVLLYPWRLRLDRVWLTGR
jgi:hypothetical protein